MRELHPEIYRIDNAKPETKMDQTRDRTFDPQVSFVPPVSDKKQEGYLDL